jgi:hypothetical protein
MLFQRAAGGGIEVADDPAAAPTHVPLDFAHVSSLRWCGERGELLASAGPDREERRLFACRPGSAWRQVGDSFVDEPVASTDRYLAWHGRGISVLDEDGTVLHELRHGRSYAAPASISLSRDGGYLAWVRWRGDDKKLCVMSVADYRMTEYSHSLYRYAWLDGRRLVFLLGGPPRVLDAATGETQRFAAERYSHVAAADDRVWLTSEPRDAVVTCSPDGSSMREVWREQRSIADRLKRKRRRADSIVPLDDGSAWLELEVYRGPYRIVRREEKWVGALAASAEGWRPLLDCHQPEFGFLLPFD